MIPRKVGLKAPQSVLCSLLSQVHLKDQLREAADNRKNTPKTFPVEVRAASSPPVFRDDSKERLDRAVLEALSRANQNAVQEGESLVPFSKQDKTLQVQLRDSAFGDMLDVKRAGRELAESFIMKYPESFKIRFSDKMSLEKLTNIQEFCRDKKLTRVKEMYNDIINDRGHRHIEDKKKDVDAILDFFAYYNISNNETEKAMRYNRSKNVYEYNDSCAVTQERWNTQLPYTRSLFKTLEVERRNVAQIRHAVVTDSEFDGIAPEDKQKLLTQNERETFINPAWVSTHLPQSKEGLTESEQIGNKHWEDEQYIQSAWYSDASKTPLTVSVMDSASSLAVECLRYLELEELLTSDNYDSIIQGAVRFYRPDLAWSFYQEMREKDLHPSTQTILDIIYSITHEMSPDKFVSDGAPEKIAGILLDLTDNPNAHLSDELFLNLFYGVHCTAEAVELYDGEGEPTPLLEAINKYNYNVLDELSKCLHQEKFKLRFSIAFKMMMMCNLTNKDRPKTWFVHELNNSLFRLYNSHPHMFIRDFESREGLFFLPRLVSYARIRSGSGYTGDDFLLKHKDDIKANITGSSKASVKPGGMLLNMLRFDLSTMDGVPLPQSTYSHLSEIKKATIFDLYRDLISDNLEQVHFKEARLTLTQAFFLLEAMDVHSAPPEYILSLYKYLLDEFVRVDALTIQIPEEEGSHAAEIFFFIEMFFNRLNGKFLNMFFLNEDSRRATISSDAIRNQSRKMKLSESNILDVVNMTRSGMQLLMKREGIPTTAMAYLLVSFTLLAREHETAWKLLHVYNTFEIPLDRIPLLRFIDLTPNWEEDSELYLSPVPEPLQSKVREMIKELEKIHRKTIVDLSAMEGQRPPKKPTVERFSLQDDPVEKTLKDWSHIGTNA